MTAPAVGLAGFFARIDECRDKRSLTHGAHPYPAKFIPEIPRRLVQCLSEPGDVVVDPMCGSGTVLVEASALGRPAVGIDINPVAVLASRAKTTPIGAPTVDELEHLLAQLGEVQRALRSGSSVATDLVAPSALPSFRHREKWFSDQALGELGYAKAAIAQCRGSARTLGRCALSAVIVEVSNQESETRWCAKTRLMAPGQVLGRLATRLRHLVTASVDYSQCDPEPVVVLEGDARGLAVADSSVQLVVTSPPYANTHDYYLYHKLRLFWLDREVGPVQSSEIGSRNRHSDKGEPIGTYLAEMGEVLAEIARVLVPGGRAAIVVGDAVVRGEFFAMDELFVAAAQCHGLALVERYGYGHQRLNALFPPKFGTPRPKTTHVLVFQR